MSHGTESSVELPTVYRGAKKICEVAGINPKRFGYFVNELGLPAFKIDNDSNVWMATADDLIAWIGARKEAFFNERKKN